MNFHLTFREISLTFRDQFDIKNYIQFISFNGADVHVCECVHCNYSILTVITLLHLHCYFIEHIVFNLIVVKYISVKSSHFTSKFILKISAFDKNKFQHGPHIGSYIHQRGTTIKYECLSKHFPHNPFNRISWDYLNVNVTHGCIISFQGWMGFFFCRRIFSMTRRCLRCRRCDDECVQQGGKHRGHVSICNIPILTTPPTFTT